MTGVAAGGARRIEIRLELRGAGYIFLGRTFTTNGGRPMLTLSISQPRAAEPNARTSRRIRPTSPFSIVVPDGAYTVVEAVRSPANRMSSAEYTFTRRFFAMVASALGTSHRVVGA